MATEPRPRSSEDDEALMQSAADLMDTLDETMVAVRDFTEQLRRLAEEWEIAGA